ncbi:MAG TPA: Ig-like domain-containing protein [Gemmatimonadaceae bacterium]|nr:Ig-like domain-containing protein [Gemmatimonadaceae bacterium]
MDARLLSRLRRGSTVLRLCCLTSLAAALGCGSDPAAPTPAQEGSHLYWALALDQHAINLSTVAPYDTVRITATPLGSTGEPLPDAAAPTYRSGDPERLQVTADGVLHAIGSGAAIPVIAELTMGNIKHTDTALVDITTDSAPPMLGSFSIHPLAGDSAIWEANRLEDFPLRGPVMITPHDADGNPITGIGVYFASSDTTVATIDRQTGELNGLRPGQITITASTTAYGVVRADTLPFTITMPTVMAIFAVPTNPDAPDADIVFQPKSVTIAAGGTVLFARGIFSAIEITFDDTTNVAEDHLFCYCGSGNISTFGGDTLDPFANGVRARSFPVPGTYVFHTSELGGATGSVVVEPPPASARRARDGVTVEGER